MVLYDEVYLDWVENEDLMLTQNCHRLKKIAHYSGVLKLI